MPLLTNYYWLRFFLFNDISKWLISISFCYSQSKPHLSPLGALAHISSYYMQIFRVTEANSWPSSLVFLELKTGFSEIVSDRSSIKIDKEMYFDVVY